MHGRSDGVLSWSCTPVELLFTLTCRVDPSGVRFGSGEASIPYIESRAKVFNVQMLTAPPDLLYC